MNAVVPAKRNTRRYGVPGGSARPVTYAARKPITAQYADHMARLRPIENSPGITVNTTTGPCFTRSLNAGEFILSRLVGRRTKEAPRGLASGRRAAINCRPLAALGKSHLFHGGVLRLIQLGLEKSTGVR